MAQMASKMMKGGGDDAAQPMDRLADRELEVFELIGRGLTSREISERLGVGLASVDTYRTRIKEKLKLENMSRLRAEASRWVRERE
jgi:DNA-binding NarL/FixJ family response regulator